MHFSTCKKWQTHFEIPSTRRKSNHSLVVLSTPAVWSPCLQGAQKNWDPTTTSLLPLVLIYLSVWIKACIPDKGDVRRVLTATEAAECTRFGRCAGRNKKRRLYLWSLDRREPLSIPLISPSPLEKKKARKAARFWVGWRAGGLARAHAQGPPCMPFSFNDTNHSATTHDHISSGIMHSGCSLQTLCCLLHSQAGGSVIQRVKEALPNQLSWMSALPNWLRQ